MPLTSMCEGLRKAQAEGYALPLFDTFDMLATQGIFDALEEWRAPAMVGIYAHYVDQPAARAFSALIRTFAEDATVPVSLMLDHGGSLESCCRALTYGFTDVMYDGSSLPLEENIANTKLIVRAAHAVGVGVEAELGHVGTGAEYGDLSTLRQGFTDPEVAERFVAETGVDVLAVAIGSAHGTYRSEPHLDLELLAEIRRRVDVPLALHGGSGLSAEQFRGAIAGGIAKINIFTDLGLTAGTRMVEASRAEGASYFSIGEAVRESFRERCGYYLDLFGCGHKA